MSRILGLQVENIRKLRAIDLRPGDDSIIEIAGKNGEGKSSLLESIQIALEGPTRGDKNIVRHGEESGRVWTEIGQDGIVDFIIERQFQDGKTTLKIKTETGQIVSSPVEFLRKKIGPGAVDVADFVDGKGAEAKKARVKRLAAACGLDLDKYNAKRRELFETRTDTNRELKRSKTQLQALLDTHGPIHRNKDIPDEPQSVVEMSRNLEQLRKRRREYEGLADKLDSLNSEVQRLLQDLENKKSEIREISAKIQNAETPSVNEIEEAEKKISDVDEVNAKASLKRQMLELSTAVREGETKSGELSDRIEKIDKKFENTIADSIDIPGLTLSEDGIFLNETPFENISDAEKIKVAIAVAVKQNPEIRVLFVTQASLLDSDSRALIQKLAEKHNFQVWEEIVAEDGYEIIIEDGEIK